MEAMVRVSARPSRSWPLVGDLGSLLRIGASARFRASTRRRIRTSVRQSMWLALLAAVVDCAWFLTIHPGEAGRILAANGLTAAAALAARSAVGRYRRVSAEGTLFGVLLAVDLSIAIVIGIGVRVSLLCAGYVLLLPPIVALLVPWSTRLHLTWLAMHGLAAIGLCALVPAEVVAIDGPRTLLALLLVSSAGSIFGHLTNLRARVTSFTLIEQIRFMNRQARRDEASLRQLNLRLEQVSWTDQLTGLGNRLALQRHLGVIRSRIDRYGDRYALLMLDVDHFKDINDMHGHFAGDDVLRRVAAAVDEATRASDATYRVGGEEFLCVIAVANDREARIVAERVRHAVERLGIDNPGNLPWGIVTVSVGLAVIDGGDVGESDESWLQRVDAALYEAKRQGRNRISLA
jgi:diguanylate cyclase (GGDEF)-like protein